MPKLVGYKPELPLTIFVSTWTVSVTQQPGEGERGRETGGHLRRHCLSDEVQPYLTLAL